MDKSRSETPVALIGSFEPLLDHAAAPLVEGEKLNMRADFKLFFAELLCQVVRHIPLWSGRAHLALGEGCMAIGMELLRCGGL